MSPKDKASRSLVQAEAEAPPQQRFNVVKGRLEALSRKVREFVEDRAILCQPERIYVCDGSEAERKEIVDQLQTDGVLRPLPKYKNCWLAITDPADVARVESKTFMVTEEMQASTPLPKQGIKGQLTNWMSPRDFENAYNERFPGCMKGRTMYVIPFSMGPVGSPLSKVGVELSDSAYVVASMRIMTRVGADVLAWLGDGDFVKGLHSVGQPLPAAKPPVNNWPCNPERTMIAHVPERNEICSYGSGYGGNSLLGKKCFALRLGSILGRKEGWLAEHMLILGITNPEGVKRYIAAAFPSACGKTNLAMMTPSLPGYKVECVGDDIAWMSFDAGGQLRAINPEAGFFGVAPGTSIRTSPNAMKSIGQDTIFTNVATTSDGGVFWEGMDEGELAPGCTVTSWQGVENWTPACGQPAAHPNSRFCTPASRCPIIDGAWEDPRGVPIDAIIFGGRRPEGVPLVYEAFGWRHGVLVGAAMRSEATAAAEHQGKVIMHDPFAMRPFFGYNFGHYLKHWLSMADAAPRGVGAARKLPKIFHVNWFRKGPSGEFLWPGFGENARVLDWILRRIDGVACCRPTAIGFVPSDCAIDLAGLPPQSVDMRRLLDVSKEFWEKEVAAIRRYFDEQLQADLPDEIRVELDALDDRVARMSA